MPSGRGARGPPPDPQVTFRTAGEEDLTAVQELLSSAAEWALRRTGVSMWPVPFPADLLEPPLRRGETVLAVLDGRAAGTFNLAKEDLPAWGPQPPVAGYLHRLAIRPDLTGRGLGVALLREAEARVLRWGRSKLRLDTLASNGRLVRYYRDLGFHEVGRVRAHPAGEEVSLVLLERTLG